jgi:hypothetical protein
MAREETAKLMRNVNLLVILGTMHLFTFNVCGDQLCHLSWEYYTLLCRTDVSCLFIITNTLSCDNFTMESIHVLKIPSQVRAKMPKPCE